MKVQILGGGWISASGSGTLGRAEDCRFDGPLTDLPDPGAILPRVPARWGRCDLFSKTGLLAATLALRDAGASLNEEFRPWGIVLGSVRESWETDLAYWETTLDEGGCLASPNLFSYTLPGTVAGELAILYRMTGPVLTTAMDPAGTGDSPLLAASLLLESGAAPVVLCGWIDTPVPRLRFRNESPSGALFLLLSAGPVPPSGMERPPAVRGSFDSLNPGSLISLYRGCLK
jgi:3-oxoacyl-(acyl-carrier-protein) synthase